MTAAGGGRAQKEDLAAALRTANEEINSQVAAASAKDRENSQLWEQACPYRISDTYLCSTFNPPLRTTQI